MYYIMISKGLGDSIEKITSKIGLKSFAQMTAQAMGYNDCGCNKRKEWLNNQFPYKH